MYDGRSGSFTQVSGFVRPGTYYVNVHKWHGRAGSYQIKSDFLTPPSANDVEGNDTPASATQATLNGTMTGHLGYFSNGTYDTDDWWKFTVPADGKVVVQVTSDSVIGLVLFLIWISPFSMSTEPQTSSMTASMGSFPNALCTCGLGFSMHTFIVGRGTVAAIR